MYFQTTYIIIAEIEERCAYRQITISNNVKIYSFILEKIKNNNVNAENIKKRIARTELYLFNKYIKS